MHSLHGRLLELWLFGLDVAFRVLSDVSLLQSGFEGLNFRLTCKPFHVHLRLIGRYRHLSFSLVLLVSHFEGFSLDLILLALPRIGLNLVVGKGGSGCLGAHDESLDRLFGVSTLLIIKACLDADGLQDYLVLLGRVYLEPNCAHWSLYL